MNEFKFSECIEIRELLGKKADNELALMELIEDVPEDSIYYHTHSYFLRHFYLTGQYSNDFANWIYMEIRDPVLGEKLGSVTPGPGKTIENIRTEVVEIIDGHLSNIKSIPFIIQGHPFYFVKSQIIEIENDIRAKSLDEFIDVLKKIHASAIYYHVFEAMIRAKKGKSDFSIWLDEALGLSELARKIENIDFYMYSLESLRSEIVKLCENERKKMV